PGRPVGDPLPAGGELLPVMASERSWVAATREGKVFGVTWEDAGAGAAFGRLVEAWQAAVPQRLIHGRFVGGRVLLPSEAGTLVSLEGAAHQEGWRMTLGRDDRIQVIPRAQALLVLAAAEVRLHDGISGELRFRQRVASPAVGADLQGTSLRWLDRNGGVH